jgi:predicted permease
MRRVALRLLSFFRSNRAETELAREINAHLRLLEDQFIAQGMTAVEARYAARRAFGGVEQIKEHQRDARSFHWMHGASLDFKLGVRMLFKYPGLTVVGGVSIALGIAVGAAAFEFLTQVVSPTLPLDGGDRIVRIRQWDSDANREEPRLMHDVLVWRQQLTLLEDVGAYRNIDRNLIVDGTAAEPIEIAEISASAFRLARVRPLLGRLLVDQDERAGAAPVLVIGHDVWKRRFGGDPGVVGRSVRLGTTPAVVVGVMPEGFAFPVSHGAWTALPMDAAGYAPGSPLSGPALEAFGRLASGATLREAEAQIQAVGAREAARFPQTHARLRPLVGPYATARSGVDDTGMAAAAFNAFVVLFVVLICANVAALVLARAASRESEILVRSALGASRGRILMQLFVEALVLGGAAAIVGLGGARMALGWLNAVLEADNGRPLPFWFHESLSLTTVAYAALLTVLGAVIAGVIPALKVTRGLATRLRQATAGARGVGFGGVWTLIIVLQVAATVTFPAAAFFLRQWVAQARDLDIGVPMERYVSARLELEPGAQARQVFEELERRLEADPDVAGVTFTNRLPRTHHRPQPIEVQPVDASSPNIQAPRVGSAVVGPDFFDVLGAPVLSGRPFQEGDQGDAVRPVIVNRAFVSQVLGGANPLGRRLRYVNPRAPKPQPWHEIVGVVRDLGMIGGDAGDIGAGFYHPGAPAAMAPVHVAMRVNGDSEAFAPRLRAIAAALDPALRLHEVQRLDKAGASLWLESQFLYRILIIVSAVALLLSLTGIYSILAFTVSRRTREIGIRIALGADARRIVFAIFSRAISQVAIGVAAGGGLVFALTKIINGLAAKEILAVSGYMAAMMVVCLLACLVPTRRALRVQPTEALRTE